jgi:hypothetical protein
MKPQSPTVRARHATRRNYAYRSGAYLLLWFGIALAVVMLTFSSFVLPPRMVPTEAKAAYVVPVASIQLLPDANGLCRQFMFHNDSGRLDEGGITECRDLIPDRMLVETVRSRRNEAIAKVFKIR